MLNRYVEKKMISLNQCCEKEQDIFIFIQHIHAGYVEKKMMPLEQCF